MTQHNHDQHNRDIDGKLKQRFGRVEPLVGKWKPKEPKPGIGCLLILILVCLLFLGIKTVGGYND